MFLISSALSCCTASFVRYIPRLLYICVAVDDAAASHHFINGRLIIATRGGHPQPEHWRAAVNSAKRCVKLHLKEKLCRSFFVHMQCPPESKSRQAIGVYHGTRGVHERFQEKSSRVRRSTAASNRGGHRVVDRVRRLTPCGGGTARHIGTAMINGQRWIYFCVVLFARWDDYTL